MKIKRDLSLQSEKCAIRGRGVKGLASDQYKYLKQEKKYVLKHKKTSFWILQNPKIPERFSSADSAIIYQHCGCDLKGGVSMLNQSEIETGFCLFCLFFRFVIKKVIKKLLYLKSIDFLQSSKKCFTLVYYKIQNPRTLLQHTCWLQPLLRVVNVFAAWQ